MKPLHHYEIEEFVSRQLAVWPDAKKRYDDLATIMRRRVKVDGLEIAMQCNPARVVSTQAKTDAKSVGERPCFLCCKNRPANQIMLPFLDGWDLCVNPFPIFPIHLTIISKEHRPQDKVPQDIIKAADNLPGMVVFFNGALAGASAPDHLHMQAVLKDELPLVKWVEKNYHSEYSKIVTGRELDPSLPFDFYTGIIRDDCDGMKVMWLGINLGGPNADHCLNNPELVNVFFWLDDEGKLRFISIPRQCHRPGHYFRTGDDRIIISPGCVDMAGVLIVTRPEDYEVLTPEIIKEIYADIALDYI